MAKVRKAKPEKAPKAPTGVDQLPICLFAPGMTALHRTGLGGLACTLKYIERAYQQGALSENDVPCGPWENDTPPWEIESDKITLRFGHPRGAREFLKRLFALAFQIKDDLIFLPGQFGDAPPTLVVRAELQSALVRTVLQGAKKNVGLGTQTVLSIDPDGSGLCSIPIEFQRCEWYKHQEEWEKLVDLNSGELLETPKATNIGSFNPGAIVRHSVSGFAATSVSESTSRLLTSLFFLVGCVALRLTGSGDGILLIPNVEDLERFIDDRPLMTPQTFREVRIAGTGDGILQSLIRLRQRSMATQSSLPSILALRFSLRTWTRPQKSRVNAIHTDFPKATIFAMDVPSDSDKTLDRFEVAFALLPPRVHIKDDKLATTRVSETKNSATSTSGNESTGYWFESVVRPFIAENLAQGRTWYDGFSVLVQNKDAALKLGYEATGLRLMSTNSQFTLDKERRFIIALHRAIARSRGKIFRDSLGNDAGKKGVKPTQAVFNRWKRFEENLRLSLVAANTATQVQSTISELLCRQGWIRELRDDATFRDVHELLFHENWERVRNLTLFSLASYQRPADEEVIVGEDQGTIEAEPLLSEE